MTMITQWSWFRLNRQATAMGIPSARTRDTVGTMTISRDCEDPDGMVADVFNTNQNLFSEDESSGFSNSERSKEDGLRLASPTKGRSEANSNEYANKSLTDCDEKDLVLFEMLKCLVLV